MIGKCIGLALAIGVLVAAAPAAAPPLTPFPCPTLERVIDVEWFTLHALRPDPSWPTSAPSTLVGNYVSDGYLTVNGESVDDLTLRASGADAPATVVVAFPLYLHEGDSKGTTFACGPWDVRDQYTCDSTLVGLWGGLAFRYPQMLELRVQAITIPGIARPILVTHDFRIVSRERCPKGVIEVHRVLRPAQVRPSRSP